MDDLNILAAGKCPRCLKEMKTKMPFIHDENEPQPPICETCDLFFTVSNGFVVANTDAKEISDEYWELLKKGFGF